VPASGLNFAIGVNEVLGFVNKAAVTANSATYRSEATNAVTAAGPRALGVDAGG
jgi:hypothetical protein